MIALLQLRPYAGEADVVMGSPNHGVRRAPAIEGIVLHATADGGNEEGTLTWLQSPKSGVSCHLLVGRGGRVVRLVGDQQRAWHAGQSWWRGTSDVNSITLGIEISNRNDGEPFTDAQYCRVAEIVAHYCRQGLTLDDVVGHSDIAEGRRNDPLGWDWDRFHCAVQDLLRPGDLGPPYDRRSSERVAAEVAAESSGDVPPPPSASVQAAPIAAPAPRPAVIPAPVSPGADAVSATTARPRPSFSDTRPRPPLTRSKPVLCSRTMWANALTVAAAGAVIIGDALDLAYAVGMTVPEEITMWALFGVGLVNILLRLETTCPVGRAGCAPRSRATS